MKQTLTKILIASFVFSLIFPSNLGAFSVKDSFAKAEGQNNNSTTPIVKVVSLVTPASLKVNVVEAVNALSLGCGVVKTTGINLVQDTGQVNLNESANCFSLRLSEPVKVLSADLSVQALSKMPQHLSVIQNKEIISGPQFNPGAVPEQIPVLPVALFIVSAFVLVSEKKLSLKIKKQFSFIKQSLSLQQLQVMRC